MAAKKSELRERDEARVHEFLADRATEVQNRDGVLRSRAISTTSARDQLFRDNLTDSLRVIFKDKIIAGKAYVPKKKAKTGRILNAVLSDLHFHSLLDPREVPLQYGPHEEARRLASVCQQIAEYKRDHRDETDLKLHLIGDVIQNQLHDARDGAPLAEQMAAAIHLLTQAVAFLSTQFKSVTVHCTPGNHGRNKARHEMRATNQKWDSLEGVIYYAIKTATQHLPGVSVIIDYTPYYLWTAFDKTGFATHGDTVIKPGYPGAAIQVGSVNAQINNWNASQKHADLFIVGHVHVGSMTHLPNGAVFMSNGCLIPTDAFSQSIGAFGVACGQQLFESVPGHIVGDHRFMGVDHTTDKDASLERIIKPFLRF